METSFMLVCLILVGSVFIPFLLFNTVGKSDQKKAKIKIDQIIAKNNLKISESENWANMYVGLDTDQRKVLYLKSSKVDSIEQLLDLNTISGCNILEKRKVIKTKEKKDLMLEKLDLELLLKNGQKVLLSFFDMNDDQKEDFEMHRVQKWKAIIVRQIETSSSEKKSA